MNGHVITARPTANESGKPRWLPTCSCGWVGVMAKKREAAESVGASQHLANQHPPCPTPHKRRFKSRERADRELGLFWRTAGKGKPMPTRVYPCKCGGWHTTSKPLRARQSA